uniref:Leucine-rich melanocyte differentiation-associated protein n=1 Tax=Papilio xuthus TaxID=66420 RepID=I4DKT1_PAPXU|nr:unknown unsecreted protein [Papilio xuthus]
MEEVHINNFALSFQNNRLSYCGQDCQRIPSALWKMYGTKVHYLDLSYNNIETLKGLDNFTRLQELILDNNKLEDNIRFPFMPNLRTLSLNNNKLTDLEGLIQKINENMPKLSYLSILRNKACPNQLSDSDKDDSDYQRYRAFGGSRSWRVHARTPPTRTARDTDPTRHDHSSTTITCRLLIAWQT